MRAVAVTRPPITTMARGRVCPICDAYEARGQRLAILSRRDQLGLLRVRPDRRMTSGEESDQRNGSDGVLDLAIWANYLAVVSSR